MYSAGGGKSRADTYSAITKHKVDAFVRAGGSADTPRHFAEAIVKTRSVANVSCMLGKINGILPEPQKKIPGIKSLHQFLFQDRSILVRRVPGVGPGILIDMTNKEIEVKTTYDYEMINAEEMENNLPKRRTTKEYVGQGSITLEPVYHYEEQKSDDLETNQSGTLYDCTKNPLCTLKFIRPVNFHKHVEDPDDSCKIRVVHPRHRDLFITMNVSDFRLPDNKDLLATEEGKLLILELQKGSPQKLADSFSLESTKLTSSLLPLLEQYVMGHGLPLPRVVVHFDIDVHCFAYELFKIGQENAKQKVKAPKAVELMKVAKKPDGSLRFPDWKKWLSEKQFKSLFSTIARKIREKTFVDPSLVVSKKKQRKSLNDTAGSSSRMDDSGFNEEVRLQFEEDFKDFDFSDPSLTEKEQEEQEWAEECNDAIDEANEVNEYLEEIENIADKEVKDDGHPILVSVTFFCVKFAKCTTDFQADGWNLCDIALAIHVQQKNRGTTDTTQLGRLEDADKLKILEKINSNETGILSASQRKRNTKAFKIVNKEILSYVYNNCWCMDVQLGPNYE